MGMHVTSSMCFFQPGYLCAGFAPIVDGSGGFIPKLPLTLREEMPASQYVPIIGGICRDDGSVFTLGRKFVD